jgi:D-alanyl-D-alanine carboxypeptidase (penicillin-binding protein 5/6)
VDGVKTGHTETAGYSLVTSARRNDMRLISVVLGTKSIKAREDASQALINYGYSFYETKKLHGAGESLQSVKVWKAAHSPAGIGVRRDFYVTVPRGRMAAVKLALTVNDKLIAPIPATQSVGTLRAQLDDQLLASAPVFPLETVAAGGWWTRTWDSMLLWFE